jgi:soluble lytic murein transglycosylase
VIKSESSFNELARSHKGAKGLMQLMPRTGSWLAQLAKMPKGELTDPGYNLALGIRYLKQLEQGYGGDRIFTLIAYNWGPGRVESAADGERRVPPEVMGYAIKILNDYRRWTTEAT